MFVNRKYQREHGIVIHHNPNKTGSNIKSSNKKKAKKVPLVPIVQSSKALSGATKVMHAINIPNSAMISNTYDGQQIQIVNTNGTTIGKSRNHHTLRQSIMRNNVKLCFLFRYCPRCIASPSSIASNNSTPSC